MKVPTMTVEHLESKNQMVINECDFDEAIHKEVRVKKAAEKAPAKKEAE